MIGSVKINYRPKNQGCTPFTGSVLLKFCFRSFWVLREVLWKILLKISKWCTTLAFETMIGHMKINYRPQNQGSTPLSGLVLLKFCFRSFWVHKEVLWKIEIFQNTSRCCTTRAFGTMFCNEKINYSEKNQGITPFTGWILLKFCVRSFWVHREVRIVENRNVLKYFQKVYKPGFWDNNWLCENKL